MRESNGFLCLKISNMRHKRQRTQQKQMCVFEIALQTDKNPILNLIGKPGVLIVVGLAGGTQHRDICIRGRCAMCCCFFLLLFFRDLADEFEK